MQLVFSIGINGYDVDFASCLRTQEHYAARIGADYRVVTEPVVQDPALAAWLKLTLLVRALKSGYDAVAYIDADCQVSPSAPPFMEVLASANGRLCMAKGRTGRINSGVIFAEETRESEEFLERTLASATQEIPASDRANLRFENGNIIYIESLIGGIHFMDQRWNNTHDPNLDDYIRHFTGPLKRTYRRPVADQVRFLVRKLSFPRSRRAPERRTEDFVDNLASLTQQVVDDSDFLSRWREVGEAS